MLTDIFSSRRRRRSDLWAFTSRAISQLDAQLYRDQAQASGGQTVEVTKSKLSLVTTVIEDLLASAVVRSPSINYIVDADDVLILIPV